MGTEDNAVAPEGAGKHDKNDTLPRDELKNGPVYNRGCTDILCCLIFLAFIVGMIGTSGYGFLYGDVQLLLTGWDFDKNGCGYNETTKDYPYLYWPTVDMEALKNMQDPTKKEEVSPVDVLRYGACVKECPTATGDVLCKPPSFMTDKKGKGYYKDCVNYPIGIYLPDGETEMPKDALVAFRYDTEPQGDKFCFPSVKQKDPNIVKIIEMFEQTVKKYMSQSGVDAYIADVMAVRDLLGYTIISAFLIGFIYLILLRMIGSIIIYSSIVAILLGTTGGGYMLFQQAGLMCVQKSGVCPEKEAQNQQFYLYGAYCVWGFAALIFICVCCNWKNIRIGVAVMKCTASFIGSTPQIFAVPPVAIILLIFWFFFWVFIALHIGSVGNVKPREDVPFLTTVEWSDQTKYVLLYSLFGFLWIMNFIIGSTQFVIAATCTIWYYTSTSDANGTGSVSTGCYWVFRYHLGSIAFGAFLIALVQFIRIIFEYYANQLEKQNKDNKIIKAIICATRYCLDCFERFIKFITKNAYIQIAITGKNFCAAAWNGLILILKNAFRFGAAATIGMIFNVLGVAFVTGANAMCVYAGLHYIPYFKGRANNWIAPVAIGGMEGMIIGVAFLSVFGFASDTILQCFLVDEDLKRTDGNRPAIMSQFIDGMTSQDKKKEE